MPRANRASRSNKVLAVIIGTAFLLTGSGSSAVIARSSCNTGGELTELASTISSTGTNYILTPKASQRYGFGARSVPYKVLAAFDPDKNSHNAQRFTVNGYVHLGFVVALGNRLFIFVSDSCGGLIKGFATDLRTQEGRDMTAEEAYPMFTQEKKFWSDWLATHA